MSPNNSSEIDELWAAFDQDFRENLDLAEDVLLKLEGEPADSGMVAALFRAMHTFKGVARMMGLSVLEGLSHRAETLVSLVRDEGVPLDSEMTEMLYAIIDQLRSLQAEVLSSHTDAAPEQVEPALARLSYLIESRKPSGGTSPLPQQASTAQEPAPAGPAPAEPEAIPPPAAETPREPEPVAELVVEHIDPACNSTYLDIFLEIAAEQIPKLEDGLQGLAAHPQGAFAALVAEIDTLKLAAEGMGFTEVCALLDSILETAQALSRSDSVTASTQNLLALQRSKLDLADEFLHILDCAGQLGVERSLDLAAFIWPVKGIKSEVQPAPLLLPLSPGRDDSRLESAPDRTSRALPGLMEAVGEMVADQATSHRLLTRLIDDDLGKSILRLVETALADGTDVRRCLVSFLEEWSHHMDTLYRVDVKLGAALSELQEQVRSLGICPAADLLDPLVAMVHEFSTRNEKEVGLVLEGGEVELDQAIVEVLGRVLPDLVRYAIERSIETPAQREAAGKPRQARLEISLAQKETAIQVLVQDDGAGIDSPRTGRDAVRADLIEVSQALASRDGGLQIQNNPQGGLCFSLQVPIDLTVVDGMVMRAGSILYVVPVSAIQRIAVPDQADLACASAGGGYTLVRQAEHWLPIYPLSGLEKRVNGYLGCLVVVIERENRQVALAVDELIGRQQVLIRSLTGQLAHARDAAGCALLGEGEVAILLDLSSISSRFQGESQMDPDLA